MEAIFFHHSFFVAVSMVVSNFTQGQTPKCLVFFEKTMETFLILYMCIKYVNEYRICENLALCRPQQEDMVVCLSFKCAFLQ